MNKVKRDAALLISILRQSFSGIRKAVYSSVKCFVNCVLNTKWAVSICKGPWSHINKLFLNSHAWPGNDPIRDKSQTRFCVWRIYITDPCVSFQGFFLTACKFENWHLFHSCAIKLHLHLNEITIALCQDENSLQAQVISAIYDLVN